MRVLIFAAAQALDVTGTYTFPGARITGRLRISVRRSASGIWT